MLAVAETVVATGVAAGSSGAGLVDTASEFAVARARGAELVLRRAGAAEAALGVIFTLVSFLRSLAIRVTRSPDVDLIPF